MNVYYTIQNYFAFFDIKKTDFDNIFIKTVINIINKYEIMGVKMENTLNELKEQIYFSKTKEYFEEVEKSFYSENYRSAVVMLYSVVIADLLYKLEELSDYYSDNIATNILKEVNDKRKNNPKGSEWENELIEKVSKQSEILESYTITNIEYLKNIRNFSAHPALNQNNELIRPSREQTLGLIKNMLNGIFIRPPLFIKKITDNILEDIASKKEDFLIDEKKFSKYLLKKYYEKIPEKMLINIFKDIWKLTFKLDNEECNENREINLKFLILTMKKYKIRILEDMKKDMGKYNNISENSNIVVYLVEFMYYYPEAYNYLSEQNKIIIDVATNNKKEYRILAFYLYNNFEEQLKDIKVYYFINAKTKQLFEKKVQEDGNESLLIDKYIGFLSESSCYNAADSNFEKFIRPYIDKMQPSQILKLIECINSNNQVFGRGWAYHDNNDIIKKANIDWNTIDLKKYTHFRYDENLILSF